MTSWVQLGQDIHGEFGSSTAPFGDRSGAVSINADGYRVAIGAINNDGNDYNSGHVRVYHFNGTYWVQLGQDIDGEDDLDQSGYSVSLSADGNRVAIGALNNDGNGDSAGHVRIYHFNGTSWVQLGQDIDGERILDQSGYSVNISADGKRVAIGTPFNDGNGSNSGHVRVYDFNGTSWVQLGQDIDGEDDIDQSGFSVSINNNGSLIAIGTRYNSGNGEDSGHVRVYQFNGTSWFQLGQDIDGEFGSSSYPFGDSSGFSVSLSAYETRIAIGAPGNDGHGSASGHVRVYDFNGTSWFQLGQDIDGEANGDQSGWSVSLSADGTRVAIGARGNDGNDSNAGHVRVYHFDGTSWVQLGQDIDGERVDDYSGSSVSLSADGTRVAIGAPGNHGNGAFSGHVRIYYLFTPPPPTLPPSHWIQLGQDIDGEAPDNYSGRSVSINADGTRVAIGANGNDGNGQDSGHVRVYDFNGTSWVQLGQDIDGELNGAPSNSDYSGTSVSLSGDGTRVAIGAYGNDGNDSYSGHVRVYHFNGTSWVQLGQDIDGENNGDYSGWSISLSADGKRIAIGTGGNDGNDSYSGHVRVYDFNGTSWIQLGQDIDGEALYDQSGYSVSLNEDGTRVAIGAIGNDGNDYSSGHVRVYDFNGTSWVQLGQDIDGEASFDESGYSVSISADGKRVAIGAYLNDGNGNGSGHVRVYDFNGTSWVQLGQDIDGEAEDDQSGTSVSLSADGNRVAIGAIGNDGNGDGSGHVRVYDFNGTSWVQLGQDIDGEAPFDNSGRSVSLSADGKRVAIGTRLNDGNDNASGHVRVYYFFTPPPCFTKNTPILTDNRGEVLVQDLVTGDMVSGVKVKELLSREVPNGYQYLVTFKKGSLGENVPNSEMTCTHKHMVQSNGEVKLAKDWVNGKDITMYEASEPTVVYHVLLEENEWRWLKVNGILAESLHPKYMEDYEKHVNK